MIKVTIWRDAMGSLHIFKGHNRKLSFPGKYLATDSNGNEADLFFQFDGDIEAIEDELTKSKKDSLYNGYQINFQIDDLYFPNN